MTFVLPNCSQHPLTMQKNSPTSWIQQLQEYLTFIVRCSRDASWYPIGVKTDGCRMMPSLRSEADDDWNGSGDRHTVKTITSPIVESVASPTRPSSSRDTNSTVVESETLVPIHENVGQSSVTRCTRRNDKRRTQHFLIENGVNVTLTTLQVILRL